MTNTSEEIITAILEVAKDLELPIRKEHLVANLELRDLGLDSIDQTSFLVAVERKFQQKILERLTGDEVRLGDLVSSIKESERG